VGARFSLVERGRGPTAGGADPRRWRERRVLGRSVRIGAVVLPVASAAAVSAVVAQWLPPWSGAAGLATRFAMLLAVSGVVVLVVERAARRLVPLGILLQLSMSFPDRAPSRFRVASRAGGVRDLERQIDEARDAGVDDEPIVAAERMVTLMAALAAHDRRTRGHSERVRVLTGLLADELRLPAADRDRLRWAALLHDIGKLHVEPDLLNKDGAPSPEEWNVIHQHPIVGARLAAPLMDWLGAWATTIEQHHERYDGTGYPHGLAGREISYGARIVAVADAYERMTARVPYSPPLSPVAAREELTRCAGTQFDPTVVRAFLNISIGTLWWRTGPLNVLVQLPLLAWLPRLAGGLTPSASALGATTGAAAVAVGGLFAAAPHSVAQTVPGPRSAVVAHVHHAVAGAIAPAASHAAAVDPKPVMWPSDADDSDPARAATPTGGDVAPEAAPPPAEQPVPSEFVVGASAVEVALGEMAATIVGPTTTTTTWVSAAPTAP